MMQTWQMQEAKARLSELVKRAQIEGPQDITLHGESVAVVVSRETFERLSAPPVNLAEFMRASPLYGLDDKLFERVDSLGREIEL
jgi:prevent-host-death family protein